MSDTPLVIKAHALADKRLMRRYVPAKQVLLVTSETVATKWLAPVQQAFADDYQFDTLTLPDGEQAKTADQLHMIYDRLIQRQHHRDTLLIALGGGSISDVTGFAAATYLRGVAFLPCPTTLLAQVDAAIGGKTAINHAAGKNLIGAFHQPCAVIIDPVTLDTLPTRQIRAAMAEIIKVALIADKAFFNWLEQHWSAVITRQPGALQHAIYQATRLKNDIVKNDFKEQGSRALLNLGHTFAHAIERTLGYGTWHHGEAVAAGIVLAAKLSVTKSGLSQNDCDRIIRLLAKIKLPTQLPNDINYDKLLASMSLDKKILQQQLRFIILHDIGHAAISHHVTLSEIQRLLRINTSPHAENHEHR